MTRHYLPWLVAGLALAALEWAVSPYANSAVLACDVLAGWSFLIGSALTSRAAPPSRVWVLFLATGIAWFIGPALGPWQDLYALPLACLLVTYPTGRIRRPIQKVMAGAGLVAVWLAGPAEAPIAVTLLLAAAAVVAFLNGIRTPGPLRRGRRSAAVAALAIAVVMAVSGEAAAQGWMTAAEARAVTSLAIAASALWLAADLRWGGWVHDALTRLVIELGDAGPASVRDMLREALDDDTLVLGYVLEAGSGYVDEHGEPILLSDGGAGQETVPLTSGGEEIGILIRSPAADREPSLAGGVAAAAALAIGNARLHATIGHQVADVSASRRRLVAAVEAQRARLQVDVAERISPKLDVVARAIPSSMGPEAVRLRTEVAAIDAQLRGLAAGVGPTDVAIHGLPHAIGTLADQCAISVSVVVDAPGIDADVAATAFFVAAEGLANASKHAHATQAWLEVRRTGDEVVIEVRDDGIGGAVASPGSGLDGLGERLRTRNGRLEILSANEGGVRLIARLPVPRHAREGTFTDLARTA